ncbi:MAG: winged helix-turn-helix domain-containing protein [Pyrinomonadaceae bacterium]
MSGKDIEVYNFADFRLDTGEKSLLRGANRVPLTPKVYDTLEIFVENAGRLLEKDELMQRLWQGQFVEESNLTSNIKTLRKALGDDAAHPKFVETVSRRGYRFIAEVRKVANNKDPVADQGRTTAERTRFNRPVSTRSKGLFAAIVILIGLTVTGVYWITKKTADGEARNSLLPHSFVSEPLSTNGKVHFAIISPDGKNVFYTNGIEGPQSIWLRQLESAQSVEIIPPSDDFYYGLALSPDGNFLYFARSGRPKRDMGIYRVSIFGGVPTKIISGSEGWMSISPDGARISFVRCPLTADEFCSLWIADALDGKNEQKLTSRPQPIRISDNKFSPDGRTVAFAVGQSLNQANEFGLSEIDLESKVERELTPETFFDIRSLTWLPDRKGLLITAARIPNKRFRIWEISLPTGSAKPLTSEAENYTRLSLNNAANRLISTKEKQDFRLYLLNRGSSSDPHILGDASRGAFFPNGKIVFASVMSGNEEIWSTNADGTGQRQLTNDPAADRGPIVSTDGGLIFFSTNRTGSSQVWRMNADGTDQTQVTLKEGGSPIFLSPDGQWIYYHHGVDRTLWRALAKGGGEEMVFNRRAISYAVSPDGKQIAFAERDVSGRLITVASLNNGHIVRSFRVGFNESSGNDLLWMPDGMALIYVDPTNGGENTLMSRPIDGEAPLRIADLGKEEINSVAVAPDGRQFAIVQGGWKHDAVLLRGTN